MPRKRKAITCEMHKDHKAINERFWQRVDLALHGLVHKTCVEHQPLNLLEQGSQLVLHPSYESNLPKAVSLPRSDGCMGCLKMFPLDAKTDSYHMMVRGAYCFTYNGLENQYAKQAVMAHGHALFCSSICSACVVVTKNKAKTQRQALRVGVKALKEHNVPKALIRHIYRQFFLGPTPRCFSCVAF